MAKLTYRDAGLDLDVYAQSMAEIGPLARRTHSPRVIELHPPQPPLRKGGRTDAPPLAKGGKGGFFASLFSLDFPSKLFAKNYRRPVLVSCTDGVGSKLKVAMLMGKHDTVGIDLVAMSVNDCLCAGAEPLFFLDYLAMSKDDPPLTRDIVKGISDGCLEAECALVGGETAILPDFYQPGEYDLAGFCTGVVERHKIVDGGSIQPGDAVLGLASTGFHSNGYSLIRKAVFEHAKLRIDSHVKELGQTVGEALLEPTRIYVKPIKRVLQHYSVKRVIRGMAHITGGGLVENIPRILPPECQVVIRRGSWPLPPVFPWLQALGDIDQAEMDRVFNGGIGFVLIVSPYYADSIQRQLCEDRVPTVIIGEVRRGPGDVVFAE